VHYATGPTLLPSRIAEAVSDVSVAARASLRAASFLVDVSLETIRFTTSFSLELTRKALTGAVGATRTIRGLGNGPDSATEADVQTEIALERSRALVDWYTATGISAIHQNVALAEFLVQATINLMQSSLTVSATIADESIRVFDELSGDSETSRALAAFIASVQYEFSESKCAATGGGLKTFATFARAVTTFAFVQTATYKRTARDYNTRTLFDGTVLGAEETARWKALLLGPSKFQSMPSIKGAMLAAESGMPVLQMSTQPVPDVHRATVPPHVAMTPLQEREPVILDDMTHIPSAPSTRHDGLLLGGPLAAPFTTKHDLEVPASTASSWTHTLAHPLGPIPVRSTSLRTPEVASGRRSALQAGSGQSPSRRHFVRRVASTNTSVQCKITKTVEVTEVIERAFRPSTPVVADATVTAAPVAATALPCTPPPHRPALESLPPTSHSSMRLRRDWKRETTTVVTTPEHRPLGRAASEGPRKISRPTQLRPAIPFPEGRLRTSFRASSPSLREQAKEAFDLPSAAAAAVEVINLPVTPKRRSGVTDSIDAIVASASKPKSADKTSFPVAVAEDMASSTPHGPDHLESSDALMPFPARALADNLQHFVRYASASYGSTFLNFLGLGESFFFKNNEQAHANEWAFANHVGINVEDVLLSSYTDDIGVSLRCSKMAPIVNFVAVDRERQAVVLACRGTLGMSDLLVDLTADYQDVKLGCGEGFVHRGMYAAAHRLSAATGTVASVLRRALEAHPTYGLVVVGHSLGGGIAVLVGALWSCRSSDLTKRAGDAQALTTSTVADPGFVTSPNSGLPPGRSIHVFAYGPPPTADPVLAKSMAGLVTTVIHHFDCIPMLSMGAVLDLRDISELLAACKCSSTEILCKTVGLYKERFERSHEAGERENEEDIKDAAGQSPKATAKEASLGPDGTVHEPATCESRKGTIAKSEESYGPSEDWLWSLIKTLRAHAQNEKLYPPGTVYLVESFEVYVKAKDNRQKGDSGAETGKTMSARRVILRACEDVVGRFSE
jgi:hypothetical protein